MCEAGLRSRGKNFLEIENYLAPHRRLTASQEKEGDGNVSWENKVRRSVQGFLRSLERPEGFVRPVERDK